MSTIAIDAPKSTGYTIYTKSNCPYCVQAKQLLTTAHVVDCDPHLTPSVKLFFLQYMDTLTKQQYRTFPMIFYDGQFVGGYTDVKVHYEKQMCFDDI
jgi:glutaredoxin